MENVNLPITGICSFAKYPVCTDLNQLDAHIAVLGVPYDQGAAWYGGQRLGPRGIRSISTAYARGSTGFYDPEEDAYLLASPVKICDCGDADILHADPGYCFSSIENNVRKILERGAVPAIMGGDHSISIPAARALSFFDEPVHIVQFDAHLDFSMAKGPQKFGNGNPIRRMSEMSHIGNIVQIGMRGLGSSSRRDWQEARTRNTVITARQFHSMPLQTVLEQIPEGKVYITFDIDAYDISLMPATAAPSPGGLFYEEVTELLSGICRKSQVIGFDLVETAPSYDTPGSTGCRLAALTMLHIMGQIMKNRDL